MLSIARPRRDAIRRWLERQAREPFSYPDVGASARWDERTRAHLAARHALDESRLRIGSGPEAFARARRALARWEMFRLGWVEPCWPEAPIAAGTSVGVLVRAFGLWSLNACRIVYAIEQAGPVERFGFAYGTLPDHAACGEERFCVEWRREDDSVWYEVLAFSRPGRPLFRVARPLLRRIQRRFGRESARAMAEAVRA